MTCFDTCHCRPNLEVCRLHTYYTFTLCSCLSVVSTWLSHTESNPKEVLQSSCSCSCKNCCFFRVVEQEKTNGLENDERRGQG